MNEFENAARELEALEKSLADIPELAGEAPASAPPLEIQLISVDHKPTDISGSDDEVFSRRLGEQVMGCLLMPRELGPEECNRRATAAISAMKEIGARDGLEGMLAAQMSASQSAGLEFLSRAVRAVRPGRGNRDGRLSVQLMTLFLRQTEMLQRLRGRERRSVRNEHEELSQSGRTSVSAEHEQVR